MFQSNWLKSAKSNFFDFIFLSFICLHSCLFFWAVNCNCFFNCYKLFLCNKHGKILWYENGKVKMFLIVSKSFSLHCYYYQLSIDWEIKFLLVNNSFAQHHIHYTVDNFYKLRPRRWWKLYSNNKSYNVGSMFFPPFYCCFYYS